MRTPTLVPDAKTLQTIEGLAKIQCTQAEAAAVLGFARETFNRFISRNLKVREKWENGLLSGKASLRRNQFKLSETNASMAIWLGKQYLGQRDPLEPIGKKEQQQRDAVTAGEGHGLGR